MLITKFTDLILLLGLLPATTRGQCAVNSVVVVGNEPCNYSIEVNATFFEFRNFTKAIQTPFHLDFGDFTQVEFDLQSTSQPTDHLLLEACWTTTTSDHVQQIATNIIVDFPGCVRQQLASIVSLENNGLGKRVRLGFPMFAALSEDQVQFYLHCTVAACDNCPQDCGSPLPDEQLFTRAGGIVTIGPVLKNDKTRHSGYSERAAIIGVYVLAAVIGLIALAIIIYICYNIGKSNKVPSEKSKNTPELTSHKTIPEHRSDEDSTPKPSGSSSHQKAQVVDNNVTENEVEEHYV